MNYPAPKDSSAVREARDRLESLLPAEFALTEKQGFVVPDLYRADVSTYGPRRRGSRLIHALWRVAGGPKEGFAQAQRHTALGILPDDSWYRSAHGAEKMPPVLRVRDTFYAPLAPVDGNSSIIRHTTALFRISAGADGEGYPHENGISIRFLEVDNGDIYAHIGVHAVGRFSDFNSYSSTQVRQYLEDRGLPAPRSPEAIAQSPAVVEFCIKAALESEEK